MRNAWIREIETENSHDRFGIDLVLIGRQIDLKIIFRGNRNKLFDRFNAGKHDVFFYHLAYLLILL